MKTEKTAILIFAQSAQKEAANKPFKNAAQLFTQLNNHTITTVKKSNLPYYRATEEEQVGMTFGERLTNAIQSIYEKGYENVITIGNDTPNLKVHHIVDAVQKLETHKLILGPSKDGGFYLLGLHKSQFDPTKFLQLPWQTNLLSEKLLHVYSENENAILLNTLSDIDTLFDIETILEKEQQIANSILVQVLQSVTTTTTAIIKDTQFLIDSFVSNNIFNKGSPSTCLL
ncbi:DUF2064 domain-containing protein [uncultured Dokdonia sp.]|uniref:DUF2064 domain-containing protein n=1 Tax=uncultured Dokdonia sp. TaxID=575653 RepID=UPI00260F6ED9|nr:DUF2064 domain-containing protein [uncultured Dokdonia sp.]